MKSRYLAVGVLAAGLTLGLAAPAGATTTSQVAKSMHTMADDAGEIGAAAKAADVGRLSAACSKLDDDARAVLAMHRPHKVPRASWQHLQRAMAAYELGAMQCVTGAASLDSAQLTAAASSFASGTDEITKARAGLT